MGSMMILQSDPAWLPARVGFATASHAEDICDIKRDGKPGSSYLQYVADLVLERSSGRAVDHGVTFWMRRGTEMEPLARDAYEEYTGNLVASAAFVTHPSIEYMGATPDGFLGTDGLLEIKVPAPATYVTWRIAGLIPTKYETQMIFQCACTGRKWVDFCAWNPEEPHPVRALFIRRFTPDPAEVKAMEQKVAAFLRVVDAAFDRYCADEVLIEPELKVIA